MIGSFNLDGKQIPLLCICLFFPFSFGLRSLPCILQDIAGSTSLTETTHTGVQIWVKLFISFILTANPILGQGWGKVWKSGGWVVTWGPKICPPPPTVCWKGVLHGHFLGPRVKWMPGKKLKLKTKGCLKLSCFLCFTHSWIVCVKQIDLGLTRILKKY